jgi:hypothetical protein
MQGFIRAAVLASMEAGSTGHHLHLNSGANVNNSRTVILPTKGTIQIFKYLPAV